MATEKKKTPKVKLRMTYPAGFREKGKGVACISIEAPNGDRMENFARVDHLQCEFLKWASAIVFCEELRELPDLEQMIRDLMANRVVE